MPLLIDCYNLLHASMPPALAGLEENGLCRLLAVSPWFGERIVVVCDGVVKPHGPEESPVDGVKLKYSGRKQSADDVIIRMIEKDTAPRRLTVVTTDREIRAAARKRRAPSLTSAEFVNVLESLVGRVGQRSRGSTPSPDRLPEEQVDQWLEQFGIDGEKPIDDLDDQRNWE